MRVSLSALRPLVLAVACLLLAASVADANPPFRRRVPPVVYYPTTPIYSPGVRLAPSVYVYPQVSSAPSYSYTYPYGTPYYGGSYYYGSWPTYYPTYPSYVYPPSGFYYWYRIR